MSHSVRKSRDQLFFCQYKMSLSEVDLSTLSLVNLSPIEE
jgi:hypothetical protein